MNKAVNFTMQFLELALTAILRSARGVVGTILFDDTINNLDPDSKGIVYYNAAEIKKADWNEKNYKYLQLAFKGNPFKIIIKKVSTAERNNLDDVLKFFEFIEPNYFAVPQATQTEIVSLKSWIKSLRNIQRSRVKTIKLVIKDPEETSDSPYITNIGNNEFETTLEGEFTAQEYTICRAGVLAGLSLMTSATYYKEPWIKRVDMVRDLDEAIMKGQQVTLFDGEKFKIARGVTSFITPTADMGRSFSKSRLVEIMDLHLKDIRNTYDDYYLGQYPNDYDHKRNFCNAVDAYLTEFMKAPSLALNPNHNARMLIDTDSQKNWLLGNGKVTREELAAMDNLSIDKYDTGDKGFYNIVDYKPLDVMEDITINVYL